MTRLAFPEPAATSLGDLFGLLTELHVDYAVRWQFSDRPDHACLTVRVTSSLSWGKVRALGEWAEDTGAGFAAGANGVVTLTVWLAGVDDE